MAATIETTHAHGTAVTLTREIAASPERVFAVWTDPAQIMRWFGMEGVTNREAVFEARPGGAWHVASEAPDGSAMRMEGVVKEIEPARRLLQSWAYVGPDGTRMNETEVEVTFAPSATGCLVTVQHRKILHTPDLFEKGWGFSLARIEALAA
jgi:uncharacterized protein YndB with AHSA1/START domain